MNNLQQINKNGFWESKNDIGHYYDVVLADSLLKFLQNNNIRTLLDLGCGKAEYCSYFIKNNIKCDAYDGNPYTHEISNCIGKVIDLSINFDLSKKYDCVLSLEVGEHIPQIYENIFIDNLCKHTNKWLILSWAIVGQIGNGHVNCQNNNYIIKKIEKYNFNYSTHYSIFLRENSSLTWFKNTIMVFSL
jgi:cyclopropane fatty-acyl-phospholipid synthase-like methyltransferase